MSKKIHYSFHRPHKRVQFTGELVNHKTGEVFTPPSRTKQQFLEASDINNIMKQYSPAAQRRFLESVAATGALNELPDAVEFQDSLNLVIQAEKAFNSLTAKVRNRFDNDPAQFLAFWQDPANQDEAIRMGLATDKRPPPEPKKPAPEPTGGEGGKPPSEGAKAP